MNNRTTFICFAIFAAGLTIVLVLFGPKALRYPDAMEYADMARGMARGDGLLDRAEWIYQLSFSKEVPARAVRRAVLFPVVESLIFRLHGASDISAHATSALFFLLAVLAAYQLALYASPGAGSAWVALAAGVFAVFDSQSLLYSVSGLSESMFTFCVVLLACVIVHERFPGKWLLAGLLAGGSQWIRLNGFTLIVPCLLAVWILEGPRTLKSVALCLAGWAIPLLLLAARNHQAIGVFSFVGINGAIMFNEIGGLTEHGIERRLYLPPNVPPSFLWILQGHFGEFAAKVWRGIDRNLFAALTAVSPLAWGAAGFFTLVGWSRQRPAVRALAAFTISTAVIWIKLFSTGEFEGSRFFIPLAPLVIVLAVVGFKELSAELALSQTASRWGIAAAAILLLFPGIHRLTELLRPDDAERGRLALGAMIQRQTPPDSVILTDVPWAVAWYGDRTSVWIPQRVEETARVAELTSAKYVLLTAAGGNSEEIEETWRQIYYRHQGQPPSWRPVSTDPLGASVVLFQIGK